jgi:hemerythrin
MGIYQSLYPESIAHHEKRERTQFLKLTKDLNRHFSREDTLMAVNTYIISY